MGNKIAILQVGGKNWREEVAISEKLEWHYYSLDDLDILLGQIDAAKKDRSRLEKTRKRLASLLEETEKNKKAEKVQEENLLLETLEEEVELLQKKLDAYPQYAVLILADEIYPGTVKKVCELFKVYEIFYPAGWNTSEWLQQFLKKVMAQAYNPREKEAFVHTLSKGLFVGQYGAKVHISDMEVSPNFSGKVHMQGRKYMTFEGEFGDDFQQLAFFRYNIPYGEWQFLNLFLEHSHSSTADIQMLVRLIPNGATSQIYQQWEFDGDSLKDQVVIDADIDGYLFISILAKGVGRVEIGDLHYRWGRNGLGEFILGGQRLVDHQLQEIFTYFDPADFKPPLCVYFSGFRTAEGFEGFWMMKGLKTPFMLICDPRLDGGAFYLGSQELEDKIQGKIEEALDFLGFDSSQLILSGMSMGTFGASYYGAKLKPHGIVISKPLLSLGDMALAERLHRPGGFPTSLDLLYSTYQSMDQEAADRLNQRFWTLMEEGVYASTKFAVAYMKEDDYDAAAFENLVRTSKETGATILGRGYSGRHLDGSAATSGWFIKQYYDMLHKDFNRRR
ncbi:TPA: accessory Sec system protein Asp2 [Streptococcus suis]|nr:accessory Sec system protein Asp2 [Streptococcus suis]HEM5116517.1 accessory Sec system protein Asp2 [Streptococcus suis]